MRHLPALVAGSVAVLAASSLASPAWADESSGDALVAGTVTTASGAPAVNVPVLLLATPDSATTAAMKVGDTVQVPVVGSVRTDANGSYSLPQPTDIPASSDDAGTVNYQVVAGGTGTGVYAFSDSSDSTAVASRMRALRTGSRAALHTVNLRETKAGTRARPSAVEQPDGGGCARTKTGDYGKQSSSVAKAYSTTSDARIDVTYTAGAESTLGIAASTNGEAFKVSGSAEIKVTSDDEVTFPSDTHTFKDAFNTDFTYGKFRTVCSSTIGDYSTAEPTYHFGGARIAELSSYPATPSSSHCDTYAKGSGQKVSSVTASTFGGGVNISKWIGIDLNAKTGYTKQVTLKMTAAYGSMTICGTSGPPTDPGIFFAKG